ncbi:helix-turn-helix domain-containing protein [Nocardioides sp. REDSEA-S30_B4]
MIPPSEGRVPLSRASQRTGLNRASVHRCVRTVRRRARKTSLPCAQHS